MRSDHGHRLVDHTADVVLEAWAATAGGCLEEAAAGLCSLFAAPSSAATGRVAFDVAGEPDDLVIAFLEELIFVLDTSEGVPIGAVVEEVSATSASGWITLADDVEIIGPAPKAISRSEAAFSSSGDGWSCRVTVDV